MGIEEFRDVQLKNNLMFELFSHLPDTLLDWLEKNNEGALLIWDENDRICYSSNSMKRLFGHDYEDMLGELWTSYADSTSVLTIKNYLEKDFSDSSTFYLEFINNEKRNVSVKCQLSKKWDEETQQHYNICLVYKYLKEDTTKEEIVFSEKMAVLGQITAGIAHEIRNPLTSIKGFLQLLQAGVEHKEEYYNIMVGEIEKMEAITSELLHLARPLTSDKKQELIFHMVHEVVTLMQPEARMKKIVIKLDITTQLSLYCNRSQMKQVLINILKNAIEAMDEPGTIIIRVVQEYTKICISIRDEGTGFPPEIMPRLGEAFFTTKEDGTGLGLMITKQILDQHEANLEIMNNKDKGSTFIMQFPIEKN